MATKPLSEAEIKRTSKALKDCGGNKTAAAKVLGIPRSTLNSRLAAVELSSEEPENQLLKHKLKAIEQELSSVRKNGLDEELIKRKIIDLKTNVVTAPVPKWTIESQSFGTPGVPTLFLSDLHWGEVVNTTQINNVNDYNPSIAKERLHKLASTTELLLSIISPEMNYPGLVLLMGGDMISGNIHDELLATNELNTMPTVIELYGELVTFIENLVGVFGRLFIPCVTGNHGRNTNKIWNKDRHATSFDWLLYCFLAKRFENDERVTFFIPDGPDAYFKIYNHRYLLTHGDQFRGGDGMIGALGPIIRGDHRKRSRNAQIDMEYDTLLLGHWHQYIQLTRLIVNGSLKGLDEYAYNGNFPFEVPQQALWLTHPEHGITFRMPVKLETLDVPKESPWVAIKERK